MASDTSLFSPHLLANRYLLRPPDAHNTRHRYCRPDGHLPEIGSNDTPLVLNARKNGRPIHFRYPNVSWLSTLLSDDLFNVGDVTCGTDVEDSDVTLADI